MITIRRIPILALSLVTAGCAGGGLGGLGDILTGGPAGGQGGGGTLTAEVQEVRTQQQQIIVRTQSGEQGPVLYDQNTQVVYQNQQYPVTALERGDVVEMRIQEIQQGYYTDLIQVVQSVQERQGGTQGGTPAGVHRIEGTIGQIDLSRNMFTLNMTQGGTLPIYLPSNASTADRERLRDYRSGDYVRVEVRAIDEQTGELVRWGWGG
jgi:hypothetical protein